MDVVFETTTTDRRGDKRALAELVCTPCMPPLAKVRAFGARGTLEIASSSSDYKLHSCMLCQRREVVRSSSGFRRRISSFCGFAHCTLASSTNGHSTCCIALTSCYLNRNLLHSEMSSKEAMYRGHYTLDMHLQRPKPPPWTCGRNGRGRRQ